VVVKQDRLVLEGGVGWFNQLKAAIDSVEFLCLVMTPHAMTSEVVRKEWRYARQQGVCVYPVKAAPDGQLSFSVLPRWMSRAHFFDIEKEWPAFVGHLRGGCRSPRVPFMAPDLPPNFVQRSRELDALKRELLDGRTAAATGGGGFGKTTLAAAACHDADVIEHFDDGILWVRLGREPDLLAVATALYGALTDERPPFATVDDATFKIGEVLADRTCLMVIDDVWQSSHLAPFMQGAGNCVRLITTRSTAIAADAAARPLGVDRMSADESRRLLQSGLAELDATEVAALADLLGNWPVRLELGRALLQRRLKSGDSAAGAVQYLRTALARKGPDALPLDAVIQASLDTLSPDDVGRLEEFSIFPEGVAIPLAVAGALWGLDDFAAEESAVAIAETSLVRFDFHSDQLTIHADLRSWLERRVTDPAALHARLIDAWPDRSRLPNDYAWRRLAWHLAKANRTDDLLRTLRDPAWLVAKLDATDVNALLSDYGQAATTPETERVQRALRLSAHVLAQDPDQLRSQLAGRLALDDSVVQGVAIAGVSLTPRTPTLTPPSSPLLRTLTGHRFEVTAMVLTRDGRAVSISAGDWTLKIWNLDDGSEIRSVFYPRGGFTTLALADDGHAVVAAGKDGTLKLLDLASAEERLSVTTDQAVNALAVATAARHVLAADNDGLITVWSLDDGARLHTLSGHADSLTDVDVTADGSRAVSACFDGTLKVWDLETGRERHTLTGHEDAVRAVVMTPDGARAVSGSFDRSLKVWDLEHGRELRTLRGHSSSVRSVAVSDDDRRAASGSQDGSIKLWDLDTGEELRTLIGHTSEVTSVHFSADGQHLVSGSDDETIKVWSLSQGPPIPAEAGTTDRVHTIALTADGTRAVSATWYQLTAWDLASARELATMPGPPEGIAALALAPDGKTAVLRSDVLVTWDVEAGRERRRCAGPTGWYGPMAATRNATVAISARKNVLVVTDLSTGVELRTLAGHTEEIRDVIATDDGSTIVSASDDGTLKVWDLDSGSERRTLAGHTRGVHAAAVTADGKRVVSAGWDDVLIVWDLETGDALRSLEGIPHFARDVAVASDGVRVALASDSRVSLLNLETATIEAVFTCDGSVECCAFAADDMVLAGDATGKVHFLSIERGGRVQGHSSELSRV
jgi:WD40 repeat protein